MTHEIRNQCLPKHPSESTKPTFMPPNYHICPPDESAPIAGMLIPFHEHMVFGNAKQHMITFLSKNTHKFRSIYDIKHSKENIACWECITNDIISPRMKFTICLYMRNGRPTAYLDNSIFPKNYKLWPLVLETLETYVEYDADPVIQDITDNIHF